MNLTASISQTNKKKIWNKEFMMLSVELMAESDLKHQGFSFQLKHTIIII